MNRVFMDLNEVSGDQMVTEVKRGGKNDNDVVNFDVNSGNNSGLGEKNLSLEIRDKDVELEGIREKIRVLEGEKVRIEVEVKGLLKEKAGFDGTGINDAVGGIEDRESGEEFKIRILDGKGIGGLRIAKAGFDGLDENGVGAGAGGLSSNEGIVDMRSGKVRKEKAGLDGTGISEAVVSGLVLDVGNVDRGSGEGSNVRVLEGEKRKEKAGVDGLEISEAVVNEENVAREVDEVTRVNRLMSENKVLEREKSVALREVEEWKRKCGELECRVRELEERLSCAGKDGVFTEMKEGTENVKDLKVATGDNELEDNEATPKRRAVQIGVAVNETDRIMDEISDEGNDPIGITPKRKRDLKVVTSDDELDEHEVTMPKRRSLIVDNIDNESEEEDDDTLPIKQLFKKTESNCQSDGEDNTPISELKKNRACHSLNHPRRRLVKRAKIDGPPWPPMKYVDDAGEDDSESDASLSGFIVNDDTEVEDLEDDLSEDSDHHSDEQGNASDDNICLKDIISSLKGRRNTHLGWGLEAEMLADLGKDFELCMRGVCAIYRRQIAKERSWYESDGFQIGLKGEGFSKYDAPRGNNLGDFLTDGNLNGDVVRTVEELEDYYPDGAEVCQDLATRYSNQLFDIYQTDEDEFFP